MNKLSSFISQKIRQEIPELLLAEIVSDKVTDIMYNSNQELWTDGRDGMRKVGEIPIQECDSLIRSWMELAIQKKVGNEYSFCIELPLDWASREGEEVRVQVILPPVSEIPVFSIRKPNQEILDLESYQEDGVLNQKQLNQIRESLSQGDNILIAGGTHSGKTTFMNSLVREIEKEQSTTRLIVIEDISELKIGLKNCVRLSAKEDFSIKECVRAALRLRPDRVWISEVRGGEAYELIKAWGTGHRGGVCSIHAGGVEEALVRLEHLIEEEGKISRVVLGQVIDKIIVTTSYRSREREPFKVANIRSGGELGYQWEYI